MNRRVLIEICADGIESAIIAQQAGADRIELCSALSLGGLTPSHGLMQQVISQLSIPVHVLIRPRAGDFLYSAAEFEVMKADIHSAKLAGASGIVAGILKEDATVDTSRMKELMEICDGLPLTFHRAFDKTLNKHEALEQIINIGCKRILTSGGSATAIEGKGLISELVKQAGHQIIILAGAGINENNFQELYDATGCMEYHLSASVLHPGRMINDNFQLIETLPSAYLVTDQHKVQAICNQASSLLF